MADVTIEIRGVIVSGLRVMASRYKGWDSATGTPFEVGREIAYGSTDRLSPDQQKAVFGNRKPYKYVTLIWPLRADIGREVNAGDHAGVIAEAKQVAMAHVAQKVEAFRNFKPNEQQAAIRKAFLETDFHIIIEALAGTGKTTTLVWLVREVLPELVRVSGKKIRAIFLAFNTKIKDELSERLEGTGVPAQTTHSFGLHALKRVFENGGNEIKIPDEKDGFLRNTFMTLVCRHHGLPDTKDGHRQVWKTETWAIRSCIMELVGYTKNWAIFPVYNKTDECWEFSDDSKKKMVDLIHTYEIEFPEGVDEGDLVMWACRIICEQLPHPGGTIKMLDFDDMIYQALVPDLNIPIEGYDIALIDEAQDLNALQHLLLEKIIKNGNGRAIPVGDRYQSIYAFRGADPRSFDNIIKMLQTTERNVTTLPLSINYRCDAGIIQNAQSWVPALTGFKKEAGTVGDIEYYEALERANNKGTEIELSDGLNGTPRNLSDKKVSFCFLCRINVPLVVTAYQLIAQKKKVCIIGRNGFGKPLQNIVEKLCGTNTRDPNYTNRITDKIDAKGRVEEQGFLSRLHDYHRKQAEKLADEKYESKLETLNQNVECLEVIVEQVQDDTVSGIIQQIQSLFVEFPEEGVINLATVHRAKGLEFDVVFILRPELLPFPKAKTPDEIQQEKNCEYIAITRPRHRLYYVSNWPFNSKRGLSGGSASKIQQRDEDELHDDENEEEEIADSGDLNEINPLDIRPEYVGPVVTPTPNDLFAPKLLPSNDQPIEEEDDGKPF